MKQYENISIWRTTACVGVLLYHIFHKIYNGQQNAWMTFGKYGVLFFFMITGFLAFASLDIRGNIWLYWKKRMIRILPLYLIVQFLWLIIFSAENSSFQLGWRLLTKDFAGGTWTVWVTMVFYFFAPFFAKFINTWLRAGIAFLISFIPRYLFTMFGFSVLDNTWQYLCFCMQGVLIYYIFKENKEKISVLFLACILIGLQLTGSTDDYFIYSVIFMIIFICTKDISVRNKVTEKIVAAIDKYSYAVFLFHPVVFRIVPDQPVFLFILCGITGTFVLSIVGYYWIDKPLKKVLLKKES